MFWSFVVLLTDVDGALSKALLVGNFEAAVDICIGDGRMASCTCCKFFFHVFTDLYEVPFVVTFL